jgi:hypothetical protein
MNLLRDDLGRGAEMMTFAPPIRRQRRAVVAQQLGVQGLQQSGRFEARREFVPRP